MKKKRPKGIPTSSLASNFKDATGMEMRDYLLDTIELKKKDTSLTYLSIADDIAARIRVKYPSHRAISPQTVQYWIKNI